VQLEQLAVSAHPLLRKKRRASGVAAYNYSYNKKKRRKHKQCAKRDYKVKAPLYKTG
jgi:hypothetical protein